MPSKQTQHNFKISNTFVFASANILEGGSFIIVAIDDTNCIIAACENETFTLNITVIKIHIHIKMPEYARVLTFLILDFTEKLTNTFF